MIYDLIIIGGGQSALACSYFLRRTSINYVVLDAELTCGGAWLHAWDSLTLFSPAEHSSLPGWPMPKSNEEFPSREEVITYLCNYEERYKLPIKRPVEVGNVTKSDGVFIVNTSEGTYHSKAVISATGTWKKPAIPYIEGRENFQGVQIHSSLYKSPDPFTGQKVLIVGEGNSGTQILAEVSKVAHTTWATRKEPEFLPDDVDGRVLFNVASAKYYAQQKGETFDASKYNLGNIVMVPSVKDARKRDVLHAVRSFKKMDGHGVIWPNGDYEIFNSIIWCTGFNYATDHLKELVQIDEQGKIETYGTRSVDVPGLWAVGYGGWTGFASATLIGVGRSAKETILEVSEYLNDQK